jgi:hypothetical protein
MSNPLLSAQQDIQGIMGSLFASQPELEWFICGMADLMVSGRVQDKFQWAKNGRFGGMDEELPSFGS